MNYQQALCAAMSGVFVKRPSWPWGTAIRSEQDDQGRYRTMVTSFAAAREFRPSVIDLAADDWVVVE